MHGATIKKTKQFTLTARIGE